MSNKIMYRAWDGKKMISWGEMLRNPEIMRSALGNECYMTNPPKPFFQVMQYLSIEDKNKKRYCAGDIVDVKDEIHGLMVVEFDGTWVDLCWNDESYYGGDYYRGDVPYEWDWDKFEIVGNIYENPELLSND